MSFTRLARTQSPRESELEWTYSPAPASPSLLLSRPELLGPAKEATCPPCSAASPSAAEVPETYYSSCVGPWSTERWRAGGGRARGVPAGPKLCSSLAIGGPAPPRGATTEPLPPPPHRVTLGLRGERQKLSPLRGLLTAHLVPVNKWSRGLLCLWSARLTAFRWEELYFNSCTQFYFAF